MKILIIANPTRKAEYQLSEIQGHQYIESKEVDNKKNNK